jgi:bacteriorhodopsin
MSFDRPSRHKSDPIASMNSTQGKSALRYALYVVLVTYLAFASMLTALAIENVSTVLMEVHLTFFRHWTLTVPVGVLLLFCCAQQSPPSSPVPMPGVLISEPPSMRKWT